MLICMVTGCCTSSVTFLIMFFVHFKKWEICPISWKMFFIINLSKTRSD